MTVGNSRCAMVPGFVCCTAVDGGVEIPQGREFFEEAAFDLFRFLLFGDDGQGVKREAQTDRGITGDQEEVFAAEHPLTGLPSAGAIIPF